MFCNFLYDSKQDQNECIFFVVTQLTGFLSDLSDHQKCVYNKDDKEIDIVAEDCSKCFILTNYRDYHSFCSDTNDNNIKNTTENDKENNCRFL